MKQRYRVIVLLIVSVAGVAWINSFRGQEAKNMPSSTDNQTVQLSEALNDIGATYGYFFTVEEVFNDGGQINRIESQKIQRLTRGSGVKQELDELVRLIPDVIYKIDEDNPKIVHLIDAKLTKTRGYALNDRIQDINFTGTVSELVDALAKQGIRVSSQGMMSMNDLSSMDFRTRVVVKGEGLSVRKALSAFIPLEGRSNRILWVARTKPDPEATSYVRFPLESVPKPEK